MKNFFAAEHKSQVLREVNCIGFLMKQMLEEIGEGKIDEAVDMYELVGRSLRELQRLKNYKKELDELEQAIKRIGDKPNNIVTMIFENCRKVGQE